MNKIEALKPCPFCGNDGNGPIEDALHIVHCEPDWQHEMRHTWSVQCDKCTATMGYSDSEEEAVEAWNTRAYLTASDAAREPVNPLVAKLEAERDRHVCGYPGPRRDVAELLDKAASALTDLEAENARLKAEVKRLRELASELPIMKYAMRATEARLAEALKALEPFANAAGEWDADENDGFEFADSEPVANSSVTVGHLRAARRVREGGKVE